MNESQDIVFNVVADFGEVLERVSVQGTHLLYPESLLPHPKEKIQISLQTALRLVEDQAMKAHIKNALDALNDFIPDAEVPKDALENSLAWGKRHNGGQQ